MWRWNSFRFNFTYSTSAWDMRLFCHLQTVSLVNGQVEYMTPPVLSQSLDRIIKVQWNSEQLWFKVNPHVYTRALPSVPSFTGSCLLLLFREEGNVSISGNVSFWAIKLLVEHSLFLSSTIVFPLASIQRVASLSWLVGGAKHTFESCFFLKYCVIYLLLLIVVVVAKQTISNKK